MWLLKMVTASSTATVLMIQLCKKRSSFFLSAGMISTISNRQLASLRRQKQGAILLDLRRHPRQIFPRIMKTICSTIFLAFTLAALADGVVAPGAKLEKLSGGFAFTEGATHDKNGNVFFVDQPNNRIMEWSADGQLSTFLQPSGYANGMCFDAQGNLIACADEHNQLGPSRRTKP